VHDDTRELTHQLIRLGQERQCLEALLARIPARQALMQLEAAAEAGRRLFSLRAGTAQGGVGKGASR
jgi:hypothetical protein